MSAFQLRESTSGDRRILFRRPMPLDDDIHSICAIEFDGRVDDRKGNLTIELPAIRAQCEAQTLFVSRLKETRSKVSMNVARQLDDVFAGRTVVNEPHFISSCLTSPCSPWLRGASFSCRRQAQRPRRRRCHPSWMTYCQNNRHSRIEKDILCAPPCSVKCRSRW